MPDLEIVGLESTNQISELSDVEIKTVFGGVSLETSGSLGINLAPTGGFDIFSSDLSVQGEIQS